MTKEQTENIIFGIRQDFGRMNLIPLPGPPVDADKFEAVDQAIAACGGDMRATIAAMIVANNFLEAENRKLSASISKGYARGKFEYVPADRKDWYD